jgi:hypothetical protein
MRRLIVIGGLLLLLVIGGGLTTQLIANQGGSLLPILTQTANPDASPTTFLPWKAEQFFLLVGFILFNLIGIGLTIAVIIWFVDRGIRRTPAAQESGKAAIKAE